MIIYKLTQETWNMGTYSDFDLPREIGHFATEEDANTARDQDMKRHTHAEFNTTEGDYKLRKIEIRRIKQPF